VPVTPVAVSLRDEGGDFDIASMVRLLNEHLRQRIKGLKNVYPSTSTPSPGLWVRSRCSTTGFICSRTMPRSLATGPRARPTFYTTSNASMSTISSQRHAGVFRIIFRYIDRIVRVVNQTDQVKLVIFDLDNTLWRGRSLNITVTNRRITLCLRWPEAWLKPSTICAPAASLCHLLKERREVVKARFDRAHHWASLVWMISSLRRLTATQAG